MEIFEHFAFLRAWLRAPHRVAAVAPSSAALARAMAALVPAGDGWVVELGGGTGSITTALLAAGVPPERLAVIERDPGLYRRLRRRFPQVRVLCGDARELPEVLRQGGVVGGVRAVISGLPLLSMGEQTQRDILGAAVDASGRQGPLIQFTYSAFCPVSRDLLGDLGIQPRRVRRVWRNLPPATVWCFRGLPQERPALLGAPALQTGA